MNDWNAPSGSDLARVTELATRFENRAYFYDRLENPRWVSALAEIGVFDDPPDLVETDEPGYVRFPPWPEGCYLARMAPVAADAVAAVLEQSPPSANPKVTAILLECVQALPSEQFRRLAPKIVEWITDPAAAGLIDHFADKAASAVCRLVREGKIKQGLSAAEALLKLERRPPASVSAQENKFPTLPPEPVGRLSEWEYDEATRKILPDLVDSAGLDGLRLFSSLLSEAVQFSRSEGEPPDSDGYSVIWRPAIDRSQEWDRSVRGVLVTAARDAAVRLSRASEEDLQDVVQMLESQTALHCRIALHVLAVVPGGAELAAERIANRAIFDDYRLKQEYAELVRSRFGESPHEAQRTFLDWVLAGPDLDHLRPEDEAAYAERWVRNWLSDVADHLSSDDAERYRELLSTHREADPPDPMAEAESWIGSRTPLTTEEMNGRSPVEVIEFLASWRPGEGAERVFGPSIEGLAAMADTKPVEATRFTLKTLEDAANDWDGLSWRDQVRSVLAATGHASDQEALNNRAAIIDYYITHGDLDFREFVPRPPSSA